MHRPYCPRRRPPAAARRTFSGRAVTPASEPTPVAGVTTTTLADNAALTPDALLLTQHLIAGVPGGEL